MGAGSESSLELSAPCAILQEEQATGNGVNDRPHHVTNEASTKVPDA